MSRRDELVIARMDLEVVHRHRRESAHEPPPRSTPIGRDERAGLGTREQEVRVCRILPDHVHVVEPPARQVAGDGAEALPVVVRDVHIGGEVPGAMIVERHVERGAVGVGRLDPAHIGEPGDAGEAAGEVLPAAAVIPRDPDVPVVGPRVEQPRPDRRLGERDDRGVGLRPGGVGRDATRSPGAHPDLHRVVVGEIGGDRVHLVAHLHRLHHPVGAGVEHLLVVGREEIRRVPVPPEREIERVLRRPGAQVGEARLHFLRLRPGRVAPHGEDRILPAEILRPPAGLGEPGPLAGGEVHSLDVAALGLAVHDVRVVGVLGGVEAVAPADVEPVDVGDGAAPAARTAPGAVVLEAAADPVGHPVVEAHVVELSDRDGIQRHPVAAPVPGLPDAAVVSLHHVVGITGVDPMGVGVHVDALVAGAHGPAAVAGEEPRGRREIHPPGVFGIHPDLGVVERPHVLRGRFHPGLAAVVGAVEPAGRLLPLGPLDRLRIGRGVGLDHGVDDLGIARRDRDADAPLHRLGKAVALELGPGGAGVGALPERAAGAAALQEVRPAHPLPARGVERAGIRRVHRHVHEPRLVADELDELPGLAAVGGLVEPPLGVGVPDGAQRRDIHGVRVGGVHHDAADRLGLLQAHRLPGEAAVGALEDSLAGRERIARVGLAGAGPDLVGIGWGNREHSHRDDALVAVSAEDQAESGAGIDRLPDAAGRRRHEEGAGGARDAGDVADPAAHVGGSDVPPAQAGDQRGVNLGGGNLCRQHDRRGEYKQERRERAPAGKRETIHG